MEKTSMRFRNFAVLFFAAVCLCLMTAIPVMAAGHTTKYKGQDYSRVYDYDYYTTYTHPEFAGKDDDVVLKYFVTKGIKKKEQANAAFNVIWYYNANPSLRYTYETNWKKYYLYYQKKGYKSGSVSPCSSLKSPITYYMMGSKKVSLKKIYNFEYFTKNNASAYKYWKNQNDAGAVKYFVKTGMLAGMKGNEKYDSTSMRYRWMKKQIFPSMKDNVYALADIQQSKTKYLIMLDQKAMMVYVFTGKKFAWEKVRSFDCCIGRASSPTSDGTWKLFKKRFYFNTEGARCWYFSLFHGDQGFHSVLYDFSSEPVHIIDGTMKQAVSHGCVRLSLGDAKWIFDNVPVNTRVVVYNCPFTGSNSQDD